MPSELAQDRRSRRSEARRRRRNRALALVFAAAVTVEGVGILLTPQPAEGRPVARASEAAFATQPLVAQDREAAVPVTNPPVHPASGPVPVTPVATPPPPVPAPPLPVPDALPDPNARVALVEIGRIQIPKIGLDQPVREGVEQMVIDAGPAHWPGTAAFGAWGNTVLAGHRTTYSAPFRRVGELVAGDQILLSDPTGTYTYRVTGIEVVPRTDLSIVGQAPGRNLTIFTCHPLGSSAHRLVVHAELISTPRPGQ